MGLQSKDWIYRQPEVIDGCEPSNGGKRHSCAMGRQNLWVGFWRVSFAVIVLPRALVATRRSLIYDGGNLISVHHPETLCKTWSPATYLEYQWQRRPNPRRRKTRVPSGPAVQFVWISMSWLNIHLGIFWYFLCIQPLFNLAPSLVFLLYYIIYLRSSPLHVCFSILL